MTLSSGLVLALAAGSTRAAGFDPTQITGHEKTARGLVSDIECDPIPGASHPQTYRHTKKVKAFRESLPYRTAPKPAPKVAAVAKPKPVKPVVHRAPRRKPTLAERVHQTCHQTVPPSDLDLAGIPAMGTDGLDEQTVSEHLPASTLALNGLNPCEDGPCGILGGTPVGFTPGGSSSGTDGSSSGASGSGGGSGGSGGSSGASSGSSGGSSGASSGSSGGSSGTSSGSSGGSSGTSSGSSGGSSGTSSGSSGGSSGTSSGSSGGSSGTSSGSSGGSSGTSSGSSGGSSGTSSGSSGGSSSGAEVPEPATGLLYGLGAVGALLARRRRRAA